MILVAFEDITERKKAGEAIGRQAELINLSPDAIIVTNIGGEAKFWNLGAEKLYGWTQDEVLGKQIHTLLKTKFPDPIENIMSKIKQVGSWKGDLMQLSKEGKEVFVQSRWLSRLDASGQIVEVLKSNIDITERKKAEEALRIVAENLKRSNSELEQFAYVASHDLQEPLRMVTSYTQLLEQRYKGKLDADADEFIRYAVDGANRMRSLIDDLLSYSRVTRRGNPFGPTESELALDVALKSLQMLIEENGAVVTHDQLPEVMADEGQLVQILQNLIGNAIKFHAKEPPRVHVSAQHHQETEYLFSVQDNGIGIDPNILIVCSSFSSGFTPKKSILELELVLRSARESLSAMAGESGLNHNQEEAQQYTSL